MTEKIPRHSFFVPGYLIAGVIYDTIRQLYENEEEKNESSREIIENDQQDNT